MAGKNSFLSGTASDSEDACDREDAVDEDADKRERQRGDERARRLLRPSENNEDEECDREEERDEETTVLTPDRAPPRLGTFGTESTSRYGAPVSTVDKADDRDVVDRMRAPPVAVLHLHSVRFFGYVT